MIFMKIAASILAAALLTAAAPVVEAEEPSIYIGEFTVTAYCPCAKCCGKWSDGLTASGIPAGPGIVATDPDVIPLGSSVIIDGAEYIAADTGSSIRGSRIDICVESHDAALAYGVREKSVWVACE